MNSSHIRINIGECRACKNGEVLLTVLGSCVAACLFDPVSGIGGMNHILLPGKADLNHFDLPARYGVNAMETLINKMMRMGADRKRIVAKIFGGAHVIPTISREFGMGRRNAQFVEEFLQKESIPLVNSDIGGTDTRKIFFRSNTGEVFLKRIRPNLYKEVAAQEEKALKTIREKAEKAGEITFF